MEFAVTINDFSENLSALREFVLQIGAFLHERTEDQFKEHADDLGPFVLFVDATEPELKIPDEMRQRLSLRFGRVTRTENPGDGSVQVTFEKAESGKRFLNAMKVVKARTAQTSLLYCSSLISLISAAEWFLSRLIQSFFEEFPDNAKTQEKVFSLEDLKGFNSVADAQRQLIEMRVAEIMWGSLEDWLRFLKTKMNLSMKYLDPRLDEITEVFQRRNVVAHNNGIVHQRYIARVVPELREGVSVGQRLGASSDYILNAIDLIELNFLLIGAELWKQLDASDDERGGVLTNLAFNALVAERWPIGEGISYFLMKDRGLAEREQLNGQLNYWQSLKWQGRFEEIRLDVEKADFSAKGELFQLARLALLSERRSFFELLPSVLRSEKLGYKELRDWPIFREMREHEEYRKFHEEHRKDFEAADEEHRREGKSEPQAGGADVEF